MRKCWLQWVLLSVLMLGLLFTPSPGQTIKQGNELVIGKIFNLSSKILGEERPIWVYLPPDYEKSRDSYPVFYLLDGEIHFHHVSGIVEFLSGFAHMPRMIVIAVTTIDRERDFLPTKVNNWPPVAAADKFREFLKKELIPLVGKKYRVRPYRILCGHSYGGVFCIDAFLKDPDLFTAYIAISPTLSWDSQLLVKTGARLKNISFNNKFLFLTTSADDEGAIAGEKFPPWFAVAVRLHEK
jgi:predicted alpha/beta superfamily hydrolase